MTDSAPRLGLFRGLLSVPSAMGILWKAPRILLWLMLPFCITLLLDALAFYFAFGWVRAGIDSLFSGFPSWMQAFLDFLGAIAVIFALGWTFTWIFVALASPFHDYISAAVEKERQGFAGPEAPGLKGFFQSIARSVLQAVAFTALTLLFLLLGFIPLVGPVLLFLWSAFALGYAFITIPSGRMAHRVSERLSFAQRHLGAVMGLGILITAASLIPVVNILFMPVFVVAGTLLFLQATSPVTA